MSNNKKRKKSNEDLAFSEGIKIMKKDFKKMVDDMGDEELEDNTKSSHRNSKRNNNIRKFPFNDENLPF